MSFEKTIRLQELEKQGYVSSSKLDNLILFNYSDKCVYERLWNSDTLSARGTIYNLDTGEVVARAFDKFFNLGENGVTEETLPKEPFIALEKADGSLGVIYKHQDSLRVSTRGSFKSDQAKHATDWLYINPDAANHRDLFNLLINEGYTPLVEIIYPENRIIINYGSTDNLVVLAARNIKDGSYMEHRTLKAVCNQFMIPIVSSFEYSIETLKQLQKTIDWQNEGWVLVYESGFRVKVKGEDYCRIAKIKSCLSPLSVWEAMVEGKAEQYIAAMPDEIHQEAADILDNLSEIFNKLRLELKVLIYKFIPSAPFEFKDVALTIQKTAPAWSKSLLLSVMRNRDITESILNRIRPTANKYITAEEVMQNA